MNDDRLIREIAALAAELVAIPSRATADNPDVILAFVADWLVENSIPAVRLSDAHGKPVGVLVRITGAKPGRRLCLNSCLDTAPFGDVGRWSRPPLSGAIDDGRLWGRGSADSKVGAAILMHLAREFTASPPAFGCVSILFDADEHTGHFGGVKAFIDTTPKFPDAVVLGYPGHESLITGARGFLRLRAHVHGQTAHTGSASNKGINAVVRLAELIGVIESTPMPTAAVGGFPLGPTATITQVSGGEGFSQVPDLASCGIDIRLTPDFDQAAASSWVQRSIDKFDATAMTLPATKLDLVEHWPAYSVPVNDPIVTAFLDAGRNVLENDIKTEICGPSNIGNYLSTKGISTICGLGVGYANLHATDEYSVISDIGPVLRVYREATKSYLANTFRPADQAEQTPHSFGQA